METNVRKIGEKINAGAFRGKIFLHEPMAGHTTFRVGGPADILCLPEDEGDLIALLGNLQKEISQGLPLFFLGGGSNIVVSDLGIRGLVIDLACLSSCSIIRDGIRDGLQDHAAGVILRASAGLESDALARWAAERELSGAEFLAGLPGSLGGAVWMNARCYGTSLSDIIISVRYLDPKSLSVEEYQVQPGDYGYKQSPFQEKPELLLLSADLKLKRGDATSIRETMEKYRQDREAKGHYRFPCAGSVFKNNRTFGAPTGALMDSLGMKGHSLGDAQVAPYHANIIINRGKASGLDILNLVRYCQQEARNRLGIDLEAEIRFVGQWPEGAVHV